MENQEQENKVVLTISSILECLDNGMTREEIAEHFGISMKEVRQHFKHPKLKGRKPKKPMTSVLVDDTEEDIIVSEEEITGNLEFDNQEENYNSFQQFA